MAVLLIAACTPSDDFNEVVGEGNAVYLQSTASWGEKVQSGKAVTRAHWDDNGKFIWDENSDQMVVLIANNDELVPWGENDYSYVTVRKMEDTTQVSLKSNSGILKSDLDKLQVGSTPVCFFSPLSQSNGTNSEYSPNTKCITFSLPNEFVQTPNGGRLDEFAPYTYIYARSEISAVSKATIEAAPSVFNGVPAVIHFSIKNEREEPVTIKKVEISISSGGFPKTMVLNPISGDPEPSGTDVWTTVTTNLGSSGDILTANENANYYLYVFPMEAVDGATFTLSVYEDEGVPNNLKVHSTQPIASRTFQSNHIYTCNLRMQYPPLTLQLDGIEVQTIPDWQVGASESIPSNW